VQTTRQKTVLAIDDESVMLDILKAALEDAGYTVLTATSGSENIKLYREQWRNIHVVLLDFMMPEMTGDLVFDHLKQINPNIAVLVVSGSVDRPRQMMMMQKGVRGIVQKPFYLSELVRQVSQVISAA
jgi:CheY-like chemotaxis protein